MVLTENTNNGELGKVAVVTGSSKGIGKAIAVEFAKGDYNIVLNARDENELSDAVTDLKDIIGGDEKRITYLAGDISKENICSSLIEHTIKTFGRIDVLINNAGIGGAQKSVYEVTSEEWDYVIDVNLKGAFFCIREALKRMNEDGKSRGRNYSIINISSVHESIPQPQSAPYSASKGGMEMLTDRCT
jgi:glucose 1-dehydrogenase